VFALSWLTRGRLAFRHAGNGPGCLNELMNQIFTHPVILDAAFVHRWFGARLFKVKNQRTTRELQLIPLF
jgi:hypothetical protein